jgi:hypothetical protein
MLKKRNRHLEKESIHSWSMYLFSQRPYDEETKPLPGANSLLGEFKAMRNEGNAIQLIQAFLPYLAELITTEQPQPGVCVVEADFDGDGVKEIAAAYRWLGESYLLMLKPDAHFWRVSASLKAERNQITYFHAAPVTARSRSNLIVGWQEDELHSTLAIYDWTRDGLKNIVKDELYFHRIQAEDMAGRMGRDGKHELALWTHDTEEAYDVCVYKWSKGKMVPAFEVYPSYFQRVSRYYQQKVQELPGTSLYWYYLSDSQLKEGKAFKAMKSIQKAFNLHPPRLCKEKLLVLKKNIEAALYMRESSLYPASVKLKEGMKWGYINQQGQFIIPPQYEDAEDFQENGLAIVQSGERYGLIDRSGQFALQPQYETILPFSEQRAVVIDENGFHIIDEKGVKRTEKPYSFIAPYKEGRALFSERGAEGNTAYGFLDLDGKEIIPPKYENAGEFEDGKAIVKLGDSRYALINKNGTELHTYPYEFVGNLSEGLMVFQPEMHEKYGYLDEHGKVIIPPRYTGAQPFQGGRAVVNMAEDYRNRYGLIDREGNFVLAPMYNDVSLLGDNRAAIGQALDDAQPFLGSLYAIADTDGAVLTEFVYKGVLPYEKGYASVYDDEHTFFVDHSGKAAQRYPIVPGAGSLSFVGSIIKAVTDQRLSYYDAAGKLLYKQNTIIPLNKQYELRERKYKPNKDYLVYYPQVEGILLKVVQKRVNKKLKELSRVKKVNSNVQLESSYTGDFSVPFFKKKLLVLELSGYDYPFGAAHGMPFRTYPHINLANGRFYELKDLFNQNSDYVNVLSDNIAKQIQTNPNYSYVFPDSYKGIAPDQPFYVTEDTLHLYFTPYDIAPYAAGFPTFDIPFADIMDIIDVNGEFWKSFH